MKGSVLIALMPLVAWVAASHRDESSGLVVQVIQEVSGGCGGGGCCGGKKCDEPKPSGGGGGGEPRCKRGPSGLGVWISPSAMTYDQAKNRCENSEAMSPMTISCAADFEEVINILRKEEGDYKGDFWMDGCDNDNEGSWKYSDDSDVPMGSPFWDLEYYRPCSNDTSSNWYTRPCSNDTSSNCLAMQGSRDYYWRDAPCHHLKRAVCKCREGEERDIPATVSCPANTTFVFDRCVSILPELVMEWEEAKNCCLEDGGQLLRLTCPRMLKSFTEYLQGEAAGNWSSEIIFVDGKLDDEGVFVFSDGTPAPLGSPYWEVGHPTGEADHWHFSTSTFLVNDVPCGPDPTTTVAPTTVAPVVPHHQGPVGPFNVACEYIDEP